MGFIYVIKNDINDKLYVGKTITTINDRWLHHLDAYQKYDWHLYRAMRKYGIEHFWIEEIEQCSDKIINEREVYWIDKLDTFNSGYNMTIGGDGRITLDRQKIVELWNQGYSALQIADLIGSGWSSPIIDILKQQGLYDAEEIKKRKMIDIANKQSQQRIIQYDANANIINIFNSREEASQKTGIHRKNIATALDTGAGAGGFLWGKEGDIPPQPRKIKTGKVRQVEQIDLQTGEVIATYKNASEAARAINTAATSISAVCRGTRNKHRGFGWRYIE